LLKSIKNKMAHNIEEIKRIINKPQNGFKRPSPRVKYNTPTPPFVRPTKGVVHDILNLPQYVEAPPKPKIYQERSAEYIRLLKKNYESYGLTPKEFDIEELPPRHKKTEEPEKHIEYLDQVQVHLNVLKNGKVRVKCVTHGAQLYDKYYSHGKAPPIKTLVAAYKNLGYSDAYIDAFSEKYKKRQVFGKKLGKILDTIFEKSANTKKKKKEPQPKKEPQEEEEPEEEEEEDGPEEDEALVEEEEDDVEVEEFVDDEADFD